jgi:hypothetical protein
VGGFYHTDRLRYFPKHSAMAFRVACPVRLNKYRSYLNNSYRLECVQPSVLCYAFRKLQTAEGVPNTSSGPLLCSNPPDGS